MMRAEGSNERVFFKTSSTGFRLILARRNSVISHAETPPRMMDNIRTKAVASVDSFMG